METGEHLSPQNTPDSIAPPITTGFILNARPMVIQIEPIVAAVPNAVPVRNERAQLSRKAITGKICGTIRLLEYETMAGIVPLCLHKAVRIPMSIKVMSTFLAVFMPFTDICTSSFTENPFAREYIANSTYPNIRAYSTETPLTTQQSRMATNRSSTARSTPLLITPHLYLYFFCLKSHCIKSGRLNAGFQLLCVQPGNSKYSTSIPASLRAL